MSSQITDFEVIIMIVVASNLHGNIVALNRLLEEVEKLKDEGKDIKGIYILGIFGYMPYPRDVYEFLSRSDIVAVRGKIDHLIARWADMSEDEKEELPALDRIMVEWNREKLGKDGRTWIRNEISGFLAEKFGNNEFLFVYGSPFDPINGEVLPNMPTSYYEQFLAPLKKYEMIIVGGYKPFVAETSYGKMVCPGVCGFYRKGEKPTFALIDTRSLDVSFYDFEFDRGKVEGKIKEEKLPEEVVKILHHGL